MAYTIQLSPQSSLMGWVYLNNKSLSQFLQEYTLPPLNKLLTQDKNTPTINTTNQSEKFKPPTIPYSQVIQRPFYSGSNTLSNTSNTVSQPQTSSQIQNKPQNQTASNDSSQDSFSTISLGSKIQSSQSSNQSQNSSKTKAADPILNSTSINYAALSPGEAYTQAAKLDNNEYLITSREQSIATAILNSGVYKETPILGNNIVFLSNPNAPAPNEAKALQEFQAMANMPNFSNLFNDLKNNTGEKLIVMIANYGPGYAAGNTTLTDNNGQKINVLTLDPNFIDYDNNDPSKRSTLAALSNELHEIDSRIQERKQGLSYVATRPFQESTLGVDQLMEDFIYSFAQNNNINFGDLSAYDRSRILSVLQSWTPELFVSNLQKDLDWANNSGSYARFASITDLNTAKAGAQELNKKLDYLLGTNRKVTFVVKASGNGYVFEPQVI